MVPRHVTFIGGKGSGQTDAIMKRTGNGSMISIGPGRLLFSGPTTDGAYGIYVMLATSLDEAKALAARDPHHARGIRQMEVLEWRAHRAFGLDGPTIADVEKMAEPK